MVKIDFFKTFERMSRKLPYQDLFNIKTNKVRKNEINLGFLQRVIKGNLLVRAQSALPFVE